MRNPLCTVSFSPGSLFPSQIIPLASVTQLTLVDLVCALSTLRTDTVLHLVKEVVRRPQQIKANEVRPKGP